MTKSERKLVAALLRQASDVFSNHGCNDFDLSEYLTKAEGQALVKRFHKRNGTDDPGEIRDDLANWKSTLGDSTLMGFFADELEEAA